MRKPLVLLSVALVAVVFSVVVVAFFFYWQFTSSSPSMTSQEVIYEVKPSSSFMTIAQDLESAGIVRNAKMFNLYARLTGERAKVKAGEYLLNTNFKPAQVLAVITSGKSIARPFTIPEGWNMYEVAEAYQKAGFGEAKTFIELCKDKNFLKSVLNEEVETCEGYLFPETYQITKFTEMKSAIQSMLKRFEIVYNEVSTDRQAPLTLTKHQLVTLASIVEKETGAKEERPEISSVFYNRLLKGMRLQTDPTILYGILDATGEMPENIHKEDLLKPTRYNTYVISGLPPGPISNPGKEALRAVCKPAQTDYLFFVSQNNGTHIFTSNYKDHLKAVKKFQLDPKAREGKSWRDLKQ